MEREMKNDTCAVTPCATPCATNSCAELCFGRLLLEQTVKRGPCIVGTPRRRSIGCGNGCGGISVGWCSGRIASDRDARLEQIAFVCLIFCGNSHRNWFHALKSRGRLKIRALLAAMQGRVAFGTGSAKIGIRRERRRTVVAPGRGHCLNHARQTGTGYVDRRPGALLARAVIAPAATLPAGMLTMAVALIAVLFVLAIAFHKSLVGYSLVGIVF